MSSPAPEAQLGLDEILATAREERLHDGVNRSGAVSRGPTPSGLPRERIRLRSPLGLSGHYYPPTCRGLGRSPLLVAVHGVTRNRKEIARALLHRVPDQFAVLLPFFSQKRFRGYQRLETGANGASPAREMLRLLSEVDRVADVSAKVTLFGFSGGAQFAHRLAMFHPERVERLITVSAGFYTFPDRGRPFPYGLRPGAALSEPLADGQWRGYLECPKHVLVGELDTDRDRMLRQDEELNRVQGRDRVERARRFSLALRASEIQTAGRARTRFSVLPGSGHSLRECVARGGLGAKLAMILEGTPAMDRLGEGE